MFSLDAINHLIFNKYLWFCAFNHSSFDGIQFTIFFHFLDWSSSCIFCLKIRHHLISNIFCRFSIKISLSSWLCWFVYFWQLKITQTSQEICAFCHNILILYSWLACLPPSNWLVGYSISFIQIFFLNLCLLKNIPSELYYFLEHINLLSLFQCNL